MNTETDITSPAGRVSIMHITCAFSIMSLSAALPIFALAEPQENDPGVLFKIGMISFFFIVSVLTGLAAKLYKKEQWKHYEEKLRNTGDTTNIEEHIQDEKEKHTQILQPYLFFPLVVFSMCALTAIM